MPYDPEVEAAIDSVVAGRGKRLGKKHLFGGVCYLHQGNMCFGVYRGFLIVRVGREAAVDLLREGRARPFDVTGRVMTGWVMVDRKGWADPETLRGWLEIGKRFAASLPPREGGRR